MRTTVTLLMLGTAVVLLPSAWATSVSLTPGSSVTPGNNTGTFNPNIGAVGYVPVYQTSGPLATNVSVVEDVYFNKSSGGLDFFFQLHDTNSGLAPIQSLDLTSFSGYQTSVGYISLAPTEQNPTGAHRSSAGDVVSFDYLNGNLGTLTGTSAWLEIDTNATSATQSGTVGFLLDGPLTTYGPAPTPEPATTGMVGAALALMALVARRRLPKKA